jgi:glutamine amidotransferase
MRATHPTRVECELVEAQNSLIRQSEEDQRGLSNPHGWGIGLYSSDAIMECRRQVEPADESELYRQRAMEVEATTVIAHVRRATVGQPRHENTHPFRWERAMLAHNGHIEHFDAVRERLLTELSPERREAIAGTTDSEHFFHLVLDQIADGISPTERALSRAVERVLEWSRGAEAALNTLLMIDGELSGTRRGRSLWVLERGLHRCTVCGEYHAHPPEDEEYRAVEFASEQLTDEDWRPVPEGCAFRVDDQLQVHYRDLPASPDPTPSS